MEKINMIMSNNETTRVKVNAQTHTHTQMDFHSNRLIVVENVFKSHSGLNERAFFCLSFRFNSNEN